MTIGTLVFILFTFLFISFLIFKFLFISLFFLLLSFLHIFYISTLICTSTWIHLLWIEWPALRTPNIPNESILSRHIMTHGLWILDPKCNMFIESLIETIVMWYVSLTSQIWVKQAKRFGFMTSILCDMG